MAKKIDTSNLSVDYKQLMRMTVQDRVGLAKSGLGEELMQSLTPTQLALAFPKYYARQLPDIGRIITTGGAAPTYGGTAPSTGATPTAAPVPSVPSGRQNPQSSSAAKENQQNSFVDYLRRNDPRAQQGTQQTNINQYQRIPGGIDRTSKLNELKDPETRKLFATLLHAEVGGYGSKDHQAFAEKVFNRAMIENKSLKQILSDKRYFEPYQNGAFRKAQQAIDNNPNLLNSHLSTIDRVGYTGVDSIKGATHNASGSVAAAVRGEKPHQKYGDFNSVKSSIVVVGRETFYSKTWEQEKIRNLPRIAAAPSQTSKEDGTGIIPQDASKSQKATTEGLRTAGKTKDEELDIIPPSVLNMRVKLENGKTATIRELGITKFSELTEKGGQAFSGGRNERNTTVLAGEIQQFFGDKFDRVTAQNDKYHHGLSYKSGHTQGNKLDFTLKGIKYSDAHKMLSEYLSNKYGMVEGKHFKIISKSHGTGPHIDFELTSLGQNVIQSNSPFSASKEIQYPSNYDTWPEKLKKEIEKMPIEEQKRFLEQHNSGERDILKQWNEYSKEVQKNIPSATLEKTAKEFVKAENIITAPGELPKINPEAFGMGVVHGEQKYTAEQIAARPSYTTGKVSFEGFDDKDLNSISFQAGSGGREGFPSIPQGTYPLSPQATGKVISGYYQRHGIDPSKGAFGRVYNVGLPKSPTSIGFDPKVNRSRTQIQIHSNVSSDINKLISSGCLTVSPEEYPKLVESIERARKAAGGNVALVVENDGKGNATFKIMPSARATNPIPVDTAIKNAQQTGNLSGEVTKQPQIPEITQNVSKNQPDTQIQQSQAPVPADAVAAPSPQQLESEKTPGQQNQGGGTATLRQGVSAPAATPPVSQAAPAATTPVSQAAPAATTPAPQAPATPTAVPSPEPAPEPGKYGGGEITDLRPNEDAYVVQAKTGQVVAQMNSKQEILAGNEVIPTRRIDNIRTEMQNDSRNIQQEQPQQQSNQPVASMTPSTQMPQSQPNMYNDANQIYGGMMGSIYDMPGSMEEAINQTRFFNRDIKMGFNTLKA